MSEAIKEVKIEEKERMGGFFVEVVYRSPSGLGTTKCLVSERQLGLGLMLGAEQGRL